MTDIDRRPWLILSRREVEVLLDGIPDGYLGPDLRRVLRIVKAQFDFIDGRPATVAPSIARAVSDNDE